MTDPASAPSRAAEPILVVGAGPTGLVAAIELQRRGVPVRLIDHLAGPPHWSQAIFIKQRTLEILASLGLVSRFIEQGQWVRRVSFYSDGKEFAAYDFAAIDSPYKNMLSIPESATIDLLIEHFAALGGRVEYGTNFLGLSEDGDGVTVEIESEQAGRETIRVPFVIGADGYRSAVRAAIGSRFEGTDYKEIWGVFDTHLSGWSRPRDTVCAQLEAPLVLPFPLGADRWRIYFRPEAADESALAVVLTRLQAISPGAALVEPEAPQYFHSHSRLAREFQVGRVFLAGDAAHASNPVQGHGMNAGIQDAHNLGWKLAAVMQGHGSEALIRSYEAERRSIDRDVVAAGEEAYNWMTDTSGEKIAALYAFLRTPEGQALAAIAETEIDTCYAPSPILQDMRPGPAAAQQVGARACDVGGLLSGGGPTTFHALIAQPQPTVLLLAGTASDDAVREMAADLAPALSSSSGLRFLTVRRGGSPSALLPETSVLDQAGHLHERFGAAEPMISVVRPDGHVSLCCTPVQADALAAHLGAMFCAGPSP